MDHLSANDDVLRGDRSGGEAESRNSSQQAIAVVLGRTDQKIDIAGKTRGAVKSQRKRADDDKLNAQGVQ